MIGSQHILSGYVILRGSFQMHIAMFLGMIIFVKAPEDEVNFQGASLWYIVAIGQHLALSFIHLSTFFKADGSQIILEAFKIMTILAQVMTFVMAMMLFVNAPPNEGMTNDEQVFKVWLMLEILMLVSLVVTNVLIILLRSFERSKLTLSIDDDTTDINVDYLASETTQL